MCRDDGAVFKLDGCRLLVLLFLAFLGGNSGLAVFNGDLRLLHHGCHHGSEHDNIHYDNGQGRSEEDGRIR